MNIGRFIRVLVGRFLYRQQLHDERIRREDAEQRLARANAREPQDPTVEPPQ
jgi:hypothetical protein